MNTKLSHFCSLAVAACAGTIVFAAAPYRPSIDPSMFLEAKVNNPYFPLTPGTTFRYTEKNRHGTTDNEVTVTRDTKTIMGVKCVVVHDTVKTGAQLVEDTYDWYAQDKEGTVWYFGEQSRESRHGRAVDAKGSWMAGVNGAQPGIIMPANPKPGAPYRQEYLAGEAEDMAQIVGVNEPVQVPAGTFKECIRTKEWSMIESGTEKKWYARGIGVIRTESADGEVSVLISIKKPNS